MIAVHRKGLLSVYQDRIVSEDSAPWKEELIAAPKWVEIHYELLMKDSKEIRRKGRLYYQRCFNT